MRVIQDLYDMVTIEIFTQVWTIRVAGADSWGTIVMWLRPRKVGCSCIQENWLTTMRAYPQPKGRDISWYLLWIRKPTMSLWNGQMNGFRPLYAKTSQRLWILFWIKNTAKFTSKHLMFWSQPALHGKLLRGRNYSSIHSITGAMFQMSVGFFVTDTDKYLTIRQKLL